MQFFTTIILNITKASDIRMHTGQKFQISGLTNIADIVNLELEQICI